MGDIIIDIQVDKKMYSFHWELHYKIVCYYYILGSGEGVPVFPLLSDTWCLELRLCYVFQSEAVSAHKKSNFPPEKSTDYY